MLFTDDTVAFFQISSYWQCFIVFGCFHCMAGGCLPATCPEGPGDGPGVHWGGPCDGFWMFLGGTSGGEHLYELERVHGLDPLVMFVLYTSSGMWRVQAVTAEGTAFTNRLSLPEAWRGLRDDALSTAAGIEGCCFCHNAGFMGGHNTRLGAIAMARVALGQ